MGLTGFPYLLFIWPKHRLGMLYLVTKILPNLCSCIPEGINNFFPSKIIKWQAQVCLQTSILQCPWVILKPAAKYYYAKICLAQRISFIIAVDHSRLTENYVLLILDFCPVKIKISKLFSFLEHSKPTEFWKQNTAPRF